VEGQIQKGPTSGVVGILRKDLRDLKGPYEAKQKMKLENWKPL
jgi:hypothetical protein